MSATYISILACTTFLMVSSGLVRAVMTKKNGKKNSVDILQKNTLSFVTFYIYCCKVHIIVLSWSLTMV